VRYKEQYKQYSRPTFVPTRSFTRLTSIGVSNLEFPDHGLCVDKRGEAYEQLEMIHEITRSRLHYRPVRINETRSNRSD
jgi:hypothetical protein